MSIRRSGGPSQRIFWSGEVTLIFLNRYEELSVLSPTCPTGCRLSLSLVCRFTSSTPSSSWTVHTMRFLRTLTRAAIPSTADLVEDVAVQLSLISVLKCVHLAVFVAGDFEIEMIVVPKYSAVVERIPAMFLFSKQLDLEIVISPFEVAEEYSAYSFGRCVRLNQFVPDDSPRPGLNLCAVCTAGRPMAFPRGAAGFFVSGFAAGVLFSRDSRVGIGFRRSFLVATSAT